MDEINQFDTSLSPQSVREFHDRGWLFITQQDYTKAEADFRQALAKNSRYAEAFFGLGLALKHQNNFLEAQEAFEKSLSYMGTDMQSQDQARVSMLRKLAKNHLETLRKSN